MIDKIIKELEELKINYKHGYHIYFGGELLVMKSGKFVWEKQAHAKNALIGSLKDSLGYREYYDIKTHDLLEELINLGTIVIEYR